jgi:hypothetical protein
VAEVDDYVTVMPVAKVMKVTMSLVTDLDMELNYTRSVLEDE